MAEATNQDPRDENEEEGPVSEQAKPRSVWAFVGRFLTARWIAILLGVSIIVHGIGYTYYRLGKKGPVETLSPEVALGMFQFEPDKSEGGRIADAAFSLHIALLEHVDQAARHRLAARRFRVQQDIEELLRQAHSGDFDDPNLAELKRQLQEQVNETLGMRAIADVIITDLKVTRNERDIGPVTDTADVVPWVEKPSS